MDRQSLDWKCCVWIPYNPLHRTILRSIVMKQNHSEAFKALGQTVVSIVYPSQQPFLHVYLLHSVSSSTYVTISHALRMHWWLLLRWAYWYWCYYLVGSRNEVLLWNVSLSRTSEVVISRHRYRKEETTIANHLIDRDIHIANLELPDDSLWAGKTLYSLKLRNRFGVHISSILRGSQRINIPMVVRFSSLATNCKPIGDDEQLTKLSKAMKAELQPEITDIEKHEMKLRSFTISKASPFIGRPLKTAVFVMNTTVWLWVLMKARRTSHSSLLPAVCRQVTSYG